MREPATSDQSGGHTRRPAVSIGDLVADEALARSASKEVQEPWSLASPAVRALGSELASMFGEDELREGLERATDRAPCNDHGGRQRAVTLIEVAAAIARAEAPSARTA